MEPQRCKNCIEYRQEDTSWDGMEWDAVTGRRWCAKLTGSGSDNDGVGTCGCCSDIYPGPEFCCIHWRAEGEEDGG